MLDNSGMMMPAMMDQGGNMNVFGNITVIHTQQFAPRNQMMDQMNAAYRLQNQAMQQQALAIEQQKLMLEAKKIDMLDRLASIQALPNSNPNDSGFKLANPLKDPSSSLLIGEEDKAIDVACEVCDITDDIKSEAVKVELSDKNDIEPEPVWEISEDQIIYDFTPNSDYINLGKFFDNEGKLLPTLRAEIDDASLNKIKIRCDYPGAPAIVFLKFNTKTNVIGHLPTFWRSALGKIIERYNNSVFKNPNIMTNTEYVVFIMDSDYEFMWIVNVRPVSNLSTFARLNAATDIKGYRAAKDFVNWIEDNNALIENKRVKSALVVAEPIIPDDEDNLEFSPDNLMTTLEIRNVFDCTKYFRMDMSEYVNKMHEVYNIHK